MLQSNKVNYKKCYKFGSKYSMLKDSADNLLYLHNNNNSFTLYYDEMRCFNYVVIIII